MNEATPSVQRRELADGFTLSDGRSVLTVRRPAPHVELIRCEGYAQAAHIEMVLANRTQIIARCGKVALFDDLEDLRGYDSGVRVQLTDWSRQHRHEIVAFHILTRSKLVAMGVTVANLALGGQIRAHTRRTDFDAALRGELGSSPARTRTAS